MMVLHNMLAGKKYLRISRLYFTNFKIKTTEFLRFLHVLISAVSETKGRERHVDTSDSPRISAVLLKNEIMKSTATLTKSYRQSLKAKGKYSRFFQEMRKVLTCISLSIFLEKEGNKIDDLT